MVLFIDRTYKDLQTLGEGLIFDETFELKLKFKTLELPWKDNQRRISCIPEGIYKATKHVSPTFGECIWIKDVPNRSEILVHPANYVTQLLGCIAPGDSHTDINGNDLKDVTNSKNTINKILSIVPNEFHIIIDSL